MDSYIVAGFRIVLVVALSLMLAVNFSELFDVRCTVLGEWLRLLRFATLASIAPRSGSRIASGIPDSCAAV